MFQQTYSSFKPPLPGSQQNKQNKKNKDTLVIYLHAYLGMKIPTEQHWLGDQVYLAHQSSSWYIEVAYPKHFLFIMRINSRPLCLSWNLLGYLAVKMQRPFLGHKSGITFMNS